MVLQEAGKPICRVAASLEERLVRLLDLEPPEAAAELIAALGVNKSGAR
jgi:hypothetical protein